MGAASDVDSAGESAVVGVPSRRLRLVAAGCLGLSSLSVMVSVVLTWLVVTYNALRSSYSGLELATEPVSAGHDVEPGWFALTWLGDGTVDYSPGPGLAMLVSLLLAGAALAVLGEWPGEPRPNGRLLFTGTAAVLSLLVSLGALGPPYVGAVSGSGVRLWLAASMAAVVVAVVLAVRVHRSLNVPAAAAQRWTMLVLLGAAAPIVGIVLGALTLNSSGSSASPGRAAVLRTLAAALIGFGGFTGFDVLLPRVDGRRRASWVVLGVLALLPALLFTLVLLILWRA